MLTREDYLDICDVDCAAESNGEADVVHCVPQLFYQCNVTEDGFNINDVIVQLDNFILCLWLAVLAIGRNSVDTPACPIIDLITGSVCMTVLKRPDKLVLTSALEAGPVWVAH